ncbi:MAG: protoporphyrinogen oxidase [Planctomycetota bacterium]|nr:protoporphyrinogen oxidase [Planctomycetota bacterium]
MNSAPHEPTRRIAVIGGGISGLAAAHRLVELQPAANVTLFEASHRLGGVLETIRRDGYLIERSADMFTTKDPWALDLCRRVGLADQLLNTNEAFRRAFVVHRGKLVPVPEGFTLMSPAKMLPVLKTPLLSWRGKARLAWERFVPRRDEADESLHDFAVRRLGREVYDRLVQPLIGGIYTADPTKLSMQAAMPEFVAMEKEFGNLTRGVREKAVKTNREGTGARYGMFVGLREGMGSLVDAIARRLPEGCVQLNSPIQSIRRAENHWQLTLDGESERRDFDALILAAPAPHAAALLQEVDSRLADELATIQYASAAVPMLGYRRDQITHPLDGFGFVVPIVERRQILSGSFTSIKFPGRAPDGSVLFRVFIGGACQEELVGLPDDELYEIAQRELAELLGVRGEPQVRELVRWNHAMPQYHLGHLDRVAKIEQIASDLPAFALAGNAYRGVGIPFCVRSGELAAEHVSAGGG